MTSLSKEERLDVRPVAPKHRLEKIMGAWNNLGVGEVLYLSVDHDPQCMYYTLAADYGKDAFSFEYLQSGPIDWEVRVTRHK